MEMNTITQLIKTEFKERILEVIEMELEEEKIEERDVHVEYVATVYKEIATDTIDILLEDSSQVIVNLIPLEEVDWKQLAIELLDNSNGII